MDKSGWVAIACALITAGGVLGAKYLEIGAKAAPVAPAPVIVEPAKPAPLAVAAAPVEAPPPPVAPVSVVQIAGTWVDQGGMSFAVEQDGTTFRMSSSFGTASVYAQGAIIGRELRWSYTNTLNNPGQCAGQLAPGDRQVDASCQQANGLPYMLQMTRNG